MKSFDTIDQKFPERRTFGLRESAAKLQIPRSHEFGIRIDQEPRHKTVLTGSSTTLASKQSLKIPLAVPAARDLSTRASIPGFIAKGIFAGSVLVGAIYIGSLGVLGIIGGMGAPFTPATAPAAPWLLLNGVVKLGLAIAAVWGLKKVFVG
jgi:hypothetical protein